MSLKSKKEIKLYEDISRLAKLAGIDEAKAGRPNHQEEKMLRKIERDAGENGSTTPDKEHENDKYAAMAKKRGVKEAKAGRPNHQEEKMLRKIERTYDEEGYTSPDKKPEDDKYANMAKKRGVEESDSELDKIELMKQEIMNKDYDGFWYVFHNEGGQEEIASVFGKDVAREIELLGRDYEEGDAAEKALNYLDSTDGGEITEADFDGPQGPSDMEDGSNWRDEDGKVDPSGAYDDEGHRYKSRVNSVKEAELTDPTDAEFEEINGYISDCLDDDLAPDEIASGLQDNWPRYFDQARGEQWAQEASDAKSADAEEYEVGRGDQQFHARRDDMMDEDVLGERGQMRRLLSKVGTHIKDYSDIITPPDEETLAYGQDVDSAIADRSAARWSDYKDKYPDEVEEGYTFLPPIDSRYQKRKGLEGPYMLRSGKVVYYDPKEGSYYDSDSDMYMTYDEYRRHAEPSPTNDSKFSNESADNQLDILTDAFKEEMKKLSEGVFDKAGPTASDECECPDCGNFTKKGSPCERCGCTEINEAALNEYVSSAKDLGWSAGLTGENKNPYKADTSEHNEYNKAFSEAISEHGDVSEDVESVWKQDVPAAQNIQTANEIAQMFDVDKYADNYGITVEEAIQQIKEEISSGDMHTLSNYKKDINENDWDDLAKRQGVDIDAGNDGWQKGQEKTTISEIRMAKDFNQNPEQLAKHIRKMNSESKDWLYGSLNSLREKGLTDEALLKSFRINGKDGSSVVFPYLQDAIVRQYGLEPVVEEPVEEAVDSDDNVKSPIGSAGSVYADSLTESKDLQRLKSLSGIK